MAEDPMERALCRYQIISAYVADNPPRGRRKEFLEKLASRSWSGPDGEPTTVSAETIRSWIRRYRRHGLQGLCDRPREGGRARALSSELVERAAQLKKEVPERSLDRLITILEEVDQVEPGTVCRSTLHRELQARGLSRRSPRGNGTKDLDRFEAEYPSDTWQSDMLVGPWLPDPDKPGKTRRAYLYLFLDDHSRLLLHGRFSFKGDLPALELVFRRSLQKYGVPRRVYYDNGLVYRSKHMQQIVAQTGIHRIVHTQPYRPEGHGKVEALNRFIRSDFLSELRASSLHKLDALNEAFLAWADLRYNRRVHSELGMSPLERWKSGAVHIRYIDEEKLRQAFLWRDSRKPDKTGLLQLFGVRYQVSAELAKRTVEVRYDPEALEEIEIWKDGVFRERIHPFEVQLHRRPERVADGPCEVEPRSASKTDWLAHLVKERNSLFAEEPSPRHWVEEERIHRRTQNEALVALLRERLHPDSFDESTILRYLEQFGPFLPRAAETILDELLDGVASADLHVQVYLDAIRDRLSGSEGGNLMNPIHPQQTQRLRAHFRFRQVPFSKFARANNMFDSTSQQELFQGLLMWTESEGTVSVPSRVTRSPDIPFFSDWRPVSRSGIPEE